MLFHRPFFKYFLISLTAFFLFGCSGGVRVVPTRDEPYVAVQKLTSVKLVWIQSGSMNYTISKFDNLPIINNEDRVEASRVMSDLLSRFRNSAPRQIMEQLANNGVMGGDDFVIEISPETGSVSVSPGGRALGRNLTIRVSIKKKSESQVVWSTGIVTYGPNTEGNQKQVDNFVAKLVTELKNAKWL